MAHSENDHSIVEALDCELETKLRVSRSTRRPPFSDELDHLSRKANGPLLPLTMPLPFSLFSSSPVPLPIPSSITSASISLPRSSSPAASSPAFRC